MDSTNRWKSFQTRRDRYEGFATRRFSRGLLEQIQSVLDNIDNPAQALGNLPQLISLRPLEQAYIDVYTRVGSDFATSAFREIKSTGVFLTKQTQDEWIEFMRNFVLTDVGVRKRIVGVSGETLRRLRGELQRGIDQGLGIEEISRNIQRSNVVNVIRARVIARTEIVTASNKGNHEGAKSTGLQLNKIWIATPDERTRQTHWELNETKIGMDEWFDVGDGEAQFPGDPNLPAEEAINCRCVIVHEPV